MILKNTKDFRAPFFLINLPQRKNRLISAVSQLESLGLENPIIKFRATQGKQIKQDFHKYLSMEAYENICNKDCKTALISTWNALGCAVSHYKCWKKLIDYNFPYAFIVEDDIEITDKHRFLQQLYTSMQTMNFEQKKINRVKNDRPKICLFNSNLNKNCSILNKYEGDISIFQGRFTGTHFYAIDLNTAKILVNNILPFKYQVDIQMGILAHIKNITLMNVNRKIIRQNPKFETDVQIPIYNKKFSYKLSQMFNISEDVTDLIIKYLGDNSGKNLNHLGYSYDSYYNYYPPQMVNNWPTVGDLNTYNLNNSYYYYG